MEEIVEGIVEEIIKKEKEPVTEFSNHVLERFAERIMDKDNKQDMHLYINSNRDMIEERINKMYQYSELFYEGVIKEKSYCQFFLNKDGWVLIVDKSRHKFVTLYKIDLHAGDEVNKMFMDNMLEIINKKKEELLLCKEQRDEECKSFRENIANNESKIKEYEKLIRLLKADNESIASYIKDHQSKYAIAEQDLKESIEHLVSWKVF